MKKTNKKLLVLAILALTFSTLMLASCNANLNGTVPIYEGMTVQNSINTASTLNYQIMRATYDKIQDDDKDNNNSALTDPPLSTDGNNSASPDSTNPPPSTDGNNSASPDSAGSPPSVDDDVPTYYAENNSDIYITVHINNPDNYEILSFTLNGQKYSSYMFENGSDMKNLILKINVGDTLGTVDYTIDEIKYVDGTQIKDVRMEGDKTISLYVYSIFEEYLGKVNYVNSIAFVFPVENMNITVKHEEFYYNRTLNRYYSHQGIDIGAEEGDPVYAAISGRIIEINYDIIAGPIVIIEDEHGYKVYYSNVNVADGINVGDSILASRLIGYVSAPDGAEWNDGTHIHLEMYYNEKIIDPLSFLPQ